MVERFAVEREEAALTCGSGVGGVTGAPGVIWARRGSPSVNRQRTSESNLVMLTPGSRQEFLCAAVANVKAASPKPKWFALPPVPQGTACGRRIR